MLDLQISLGRIHTFLRSSLPVHDTRCLSVCSIVFCKVFFLSLLPILTFLFPEISPFMLLVCLFAPESKFWVKRTAGYDHLQILFPKPSPPTPWLSSAVHRQPRAHNVILSMVGWVGAEGELRFAKHLLGPSRCSQHS